MDVLLGILGISAIFIGVFFNLVATIGILRLPDTYTRLHASGKASTLGILFICLGTGLIIPSAILKLLALGIFIIFSGPVGSHAIAAAVHRGAAIQNQMAAESGEETPAALSGIHRISEIQAMLEQAEKEKKESDSYG
jgi:multicomponent Na+:H+ antiporter subunit G